MIIDAHLHVWRANLDAVDPGKNIIGPHSDVPIEVYNEYMLEHGIERAVLVQPVYPGEDNSYVADCAAAEPERYAAVCYIDPRLDGAAERLAYWVTTRGCRGLRFRPRFKPEEASFGAPSTDALWEQANALGIVVSILANPEHLGTIRTLAARFPDLAIVIDHMAHPDVTAGPHAPLFQELLDLAACPRVYVKVSGYYYFSHQRSPYEDAWPFFRTLYDRYGAERLIWGSDFPHVLLKSGYRRSLLLQERAYPFLSAADFDLIMGQNALTLYWPSPQ